MARGSRIVTVALALVVAVACSGTSSDPAGGGGGGGGVAVEPPSARLPPRGEQAFVATPPAVLWSVREGAAGGSITSYGLYRAPPDAGSYTVLVFEPVSATTVEVPITVYATEPGTSHGLSIPTTHPRLWFDGPDGQRLALARANYRARPFPVDPSPYSAQDYLDFALRGRLADSAADCRVALDWAMARNADLGANAAGGSLQWDRARWEGEAIILTFDWCHPHMTTAERTQFIASANAWIEARRRQIYGGPPMHQNNYYWGFLRNELLWGIASYEENLVDAERFIDDAIVTRYRNDFLTHDTSTNRGGIAHEGTQYGPMLADYSLVPLTTAGLLGADLIAEGHYWKEVVYGTIYTTLPGPNTDGSWYFFTHSDTQNGIAGARVALDANSYNVIGNYMSTASVRWAGLPIGKHARQWFEQTSATRTAHAAVVDPGTTTTIALSTLPLDYYAPGLRWLYAKTAWSRSATAVHLQLGDRPRAHADHKHVDWGSWQIWRGGEFVARETTAYDESVASYGGGPAVPGSGGAAHNVAFVQGNAISTSALSQDAGAVVTRLESRPGYAYAAVDLTPTRPTDPRYVNPHFLRWVREFLFLRGLETLVVLDRMESDHPDDTKAFLAHCPTDPVTSSATDSATCTVGSQAYDLWTLLPAGESVVYREVVEGGSRGQWRIEVETTPGTAQSHILTVLKVRSSSGATLAPSVTDDGTTYTVTLDGSHSFTFEKGMVSSGGTAMVAGTPVTLATTVQEMVVTDAGPVWQ